MNRHGVRTTSPDVVVVGGGPSGLSAAIELRRRGVTVTVIEREQHAGGAPRHTNHLGFGMRDLRRITTGPRYAHHLVHLAERHGVDLRTGVTVTALDGSTVGLATAKGHEQLVAGAVVLATGVRERPRSARLVPGDRPAGVYTTGQLQQFAARHGQSVGMRAVVVGAEHVSFSAVLTLTHSGCDVAAMVTPFSQHQSHGALVAVTARRHRVPLHTGVDIAEIVGHDRVEAVVLTDGRRIACDTVVFTGDWIPDHELARRSGIAMLATAGAPLVDAALHTGQRGVFAIGNLVHPAEAADVCALDGRVVAPAVLDWLTTQEWPDEMLPIEVASPVRWATHHAQGITLRVDDIVRGQLRLTHAGEVQWLSPARTWLPNRPITIRRDALRSTATPFANHHLRIDLLR
ncbi:MAG: FAD-dependent oxidoreductase [Actinomycetota bacterium]